LTLTSFEGDPLEYEEVRTLGRDSSSDFWNSDHAKLLETITPMTKTITAITAKNPIGSQFSPRLTQLKGFTVDWAIFQSKAAAVVKLN
jgi:hypothetical protein